MFLSEMPKGAELHTHLSGIPYAEDYLTWAAADNSCIEQASNRIVAGPCGNGSIAATLAFGKSNIWNSAVDALSVRQNLRDNRMWGHDQFFATFAKFGGAKKNAGRLLALASKQAYRDNVQYVEAMCSIYGPKWVSPWAEKVGWNGNPVVTLSELRESGLFQDMDQAIRKLDETEFLKEEELRGGEGIEVLIRYINQIYRGAEPAYVFAQMAWSFELVHRDPRVVALNLVGPEDSPIAVRDYELHMEMLDFFHKLYPEVPITLHAGELTGWVTTPEALSNHILLAVIKGHAQRIGHGVDLAYEEKSRETLSLMKEKGVALECLLSSNDSILKVSGKNHPLNVYLSSGVPVTFSSDDMGVARTTLTNEYVVAVVDQGLDYGQLKKVARNSLEYSFLKGESLWKKPDPYIMIGVCAGDSVPDSDCMSFLSNSEKAAQQWELEKKLKVFEHNYQVSD
ncbi:adenosine deaminase [Maridesulfovibrio ferrireducens]|uniref:adenosine deaminase family protein n=1 Tax=Maridesulfovibrio ferrireducens TaxID=246191 RepID=UPI0026EE8568|nr:adenosine deaminase [Maridesulfovibrio ferrireducens]